MHKSVKKIFQTFTILIVIIIIGTSGYLFIEDDWTVTEALYMTVITISTVGFGEINSLSPSGRLFTVFLIFSGFGTVALSATQIAKFLIESELHGIFGGTRMQKRIVKQRNHFVICGFGRIGKSVCKELHLKKVPFVLIELYEEEADAAIQLGYLVHKGNATSDDSLKAAAIDNASGLVAALSSDADNLFISLAARELNPTIFIIARGEDPAVEDRMLRAGADIVVSPILLGGQQIANLVEQQAGVDSATSNIEVQTSVLGFSLRVFRLNSEEILTVGQAVKKAAAVEALAIRHEDGTVKQHPQNDMEISSLDSLILLVQDEISKSDSLKKEAIPKKILIADDHRALRHLFARKIRAAGHEVITASDGEQAISLAIENKPDLVVLDVSMPGKDGFEVCKMLKQKDVFKKTPIIIFSANDTDEFMRLGEEAGADECIRKTSKSSDLLHKIDEHLKLTDGKTPNDEPDVDKEKLLDDLIKATNVSDDSSLNVSGYFNPDQLFQLTGGNKEVVSTVIGMFKKDTPTQIENLQKALEKGDLKRAEREAHSIKGGAANLGFDKLNMMAVLIESAVLADDVPKALSNIEQLAKEFDKSILEAEKYISAK